MDRLTPTDATFEVATDEAVLAAQRENAIFVFNLSGGKDSCATSFATIALSRR
jgi:hypothetical protein